MQELWTQWKAKEGLANKYSISDIIDGYEGLKIILTQDFSDISIEILFKSSFAYHVAQEGLRLRTISTLNKQYNSEFYSQWTFFKVTNSKYLHWLSEESNTLADSYELMHISIITDNDIVDIAASNEPKITFLNIKKT